MKLTFNRKEKPFVFEVENESGALCTIDANDSIGGKNKGFSPMELLASSLAGCLSIDLLLILKKQRKDPDIFSIEIEASRTDGTPSPFEEIHFIIRIDEDINPDQLSKSIDLVLTKYCSVTASLDSNIRISHTINP